MSLTYELVLEEGGSLKLGQVSLHKLFFSCTAGSTVYYGSNYRLEMMPTLPNRLCVPRRQGPCLLCPPVQLWSLG